MDKNKTGKTPETEIEGNVIKLSEAKSENKPKNAPKNIHAGHRQRLRNRFIENGLDSFEDHNALELFLFYAIPNRDVNGLAHNLINEFGSLSAVFDARFEDLCKVKDISDYSATLIKLLPAMARRYEMGKNSAESPVLDAPEKIAEYMASVYFGINKEEAYILCLDSACRLLKCVKISSGGIDFAPLSYRSIAEQVFITNAANIILVHNHVSGIVSPSHQDLCITSDLVSAMKNLGIRVSDHIIMGNNGEYFSIRYSSKWKNLFK